MLFLTAAPSDDEARVYEDRAIEAARARGLAFEVRRFAMGTPDHNVAQNAVLTAELAALKDGTPVLTSSTLLPLVGSAFKTNARRLKLLGITHRATNRDRRFTAIADKDVSFIDSTTLPWLRRVIVPSLHTAMSLGSYGVLPDQLAVVQPGADRAPLAEGSRGFHVVSTLPFVRDAGLEAVIDAVAAVEGVTLTCVGAPIDPVYVEELRKRSGPRVVMIASADPSARKTAMHGADLAVVSWHYDPHGMHILESLARGIPVCAANAGAAQQLVPQDAGVLVPPFEAEGFTRVFSTFVADPTLLARLKQNAERARDDVRPWRRVGDEITKEIEVGCR